MPRLMIFIGFLLLLPGFCAGIFLLMFGNDAQVWTFETIALVVVCFTVSGFGYYLAGIGNRLADEQERDKYRED
jgi:hypothetical protein